ncbi:MAG: hypothetical protein ACRD4O_01660 [Bryobacteraceae bacterium]
MPCPYFEPLTIAERTEQGARLPLIREYDGRCRASANETAAPEALRFRCCNQGYSRGVCDRFPANERRSCLRYHLNERTALALRVLCVEEENYAPARWYEVNYLIAGDRVEPDVEDLCVRAQILAFCRSYLEQFRA